MDKAEQLEQLIQNLYAWINSLAIWFKNLPIEELFQQFTDKFLALIASGNWTEIAATATTSFVLIITAEIGDKSQLVCMTLASKHRALPVILGASAAFALLNSLAVVFGVAIASWLPGYIVAAAVALLFGIFGIHALRITGEDEEEIQKKSSHGIFFTTFLLITRLCSRTFAPASTGCRRRRKCGRPWFLLGQSLGASLGGYLAGVDPAVRTRLQGVVLDAGFARYRWIAREAAASNWLTWPLQWPAWSMPDGYDLVDQVGHLSPVPLLLIHGTQDEIVAYRHAEALFAAAQPPRFLLRYDGPHIGTFQDDSIRETVLRFFADPVSGGRSQTEP